MIPALYFHVCRCVAAHNSLLQLMTSLLCAGSVIFCQAGHADNSGHIVKWKDEKGVTHYGDKIPTQYLNRDNSVINKQGITVQQNKMETPHDASAEQARIAQEKHDKALLGTFSNAQEIDLTRDRNLEPDLMVISGLHQERAISQKKYEKVAAQALAFTKAKKPIPANLHTELEASQAELAKIDQEISIRQHTIDAIRQRFDEDKKRYLQLRGLDMTKNP